MCVQLLIIFTLLVSGSLAWSRPERCLVGDRTVAKRSISNAPLINASLITDMKDELAIVKRNLDEEYKDFIYSKNPVKARGSGVFQTTIYGPINCSFNTQPELLTQFSCQRNVPCSISNEVSTVDTYTAEEGYNWGVKVSAQVFEVGGEVSAGGTYSCSHTKGHTRTVKVECSKPVGEQGVLELYNIKTQMQCSIGSSVLRIVQEGKQNDIVKQLSKNEYNTVLNNVIRINRIHASYMIDTDKIPTRLLGKIKKEATRFNPNTDMVYTGQTPVPQLAIDYYRVVEYNEENDANVPFTNKDGNMPHRYVCLFTAR